jgi:hypothetical protein
LITARDIEDTIVEGEDGDAQARIRKRWVARLRRSVTRGGYGEGTPVEVGVGCEKPTRAGRLRQGVLRRGQYRRKLRGEASRDNDAVASNRRIDAKGRETARWRSRDGDQVGCRQYFKVGLRRPTTTTSLEQRSNEEEGD